MSDVQQPPPDPADRDFLRAFEQCSLPEAGWTHEAHLRMAWLYLSALPFELALERIREGILRYNTRVLGRPDQYHDTITVAFARLIAARLMQGETWTAFLARSTELFERRLLERYYSPELLASVGARARFTPPDRRALPDAAAGPGPHRP